MYRAGKPARGWRAAILSLAAGAAFAHTFVYVANYNNSTIGQFREQRNGDLVARGSVATPTGPESITADTQGFILTADSLAHAVSAYRIGPRGRLARTAVVGENAAANPFSVTSSLGGRFVYVANSGDGRVAILHLHPRSGALTRDGSVSEGAASRPYAVAISPNGRLAYVANFGNDTIGMYARRPGHGGLTRLGMFHEPKGDGPYGLAIGPDGRFLYVAGFRANVVLVLAIGRHGHLHLRSQTVEPFDHHPDSLVIDPSGRYLFVANTSANDVTVFRIDQRTGRLTRVTHVTAGSYPFSLTLDVAARFVYAVNFGNSTISRYRLDHRTGLLKPLGSTAEVSYADPYSITAVTLPSAAGKPLRTPASVFRRRAKTRGSRP